MTDDIEPRRAFGYALGMCGLSIRDAAELLDINESNIKHWATGRRPAPIGVWRLIAALYDQIVVLSEHALDTFDLESFTADGLRAIARQEFGEDLPMPAYQAAAAMFMLARIADQAEDGPA